MGCAPAEWVDADADADAAMLALIMRRTFITRPNGSAPVQLQSLIQVGSDGRIPILSPHSRSV